MISLEKPWGAGGFGEGGDQLLRGPNSLRCIKILSLCHPFLSFLPSPFLPCKDTFMDDYNGI